AAADGHPVGHPAPPRPSAHDVPCDAPFAGRSRYTPRSSRPHRRTAASPPPAPPPATAPFAPAPPHAPPHGSRSPPPPPRAHHATSAATAGPASCRRLRRQHTEHHLRIPHPLRRLRPQPPPTLRRQTVELRPLPVLRMTPF